MSAHVPAWKRITIKKAQEPAKDSDNVQQDDPLNITTHLATGSLTKKQKQKIIRGGDRESGNSDESSNKKSKKDKKRKEKLPREEREQRKQNVLKDQLRYLIDFYLTKVNSKNLPDSLSSFCNVRANYAEKFTTDNQDDLESSVVEIWKFSKQKQNWLIKNFFNIQEIPVEYDVLLLSYLKELKSPAIKDQLTAACRSRVTEWNEYIEKQDEAMAKIVQGDDNDEEERSGEPGEPGEPGESKESKESGESKESEQPGDAKAQDLVPPDKRIINRSQELLKLWHVEPLVELKRFYDD